MCHSSFWICYQNLSECDKVFGITTQFLREPQSERVDTMSTSSEVSFSPAEFSGVARLFPLPNNVMFPHVVQPLHIFEDRYRELMADALTGDHLITIVQLADGWECDYTGHPAIARVGCLGKILTHVQLEDGRYNVLLAGLRRVRIVSELEPRHAFREAHVELMEDVYTDSGTAERHAIQELLLQRFRSYLPHVSETQQQLDALLEGSVPLGMLTDIVAYFISLESRDKQQLLDEVNVDFRTTQLIHELECLIGEPTTRPFPPQFSTN